ncbi:transposase [Okeania sp. SIO2B3]|uniref:RNA-guided endonuclease InsQ/TnpB family protein n=1 Tax=Okeania sp. SIO2B3 TaxID=2607784 RepID=UPI0013C18B79|nr:transposase [Okeania sp. SIO2B3]NET45792.1 transposase [Okeania sp. SIO2B3]
MPYAFEFKIKAKKNQYAAIDEAIRTGQFIRNKCIRLWMDERGTGKAKLYRYCRLLAKEFAFANKLNSQARQAMAERAWSSISRFYDNCHKKISGKKGYPKFKKHSRSIEYKNTGWKLSEDRKYITFTDKLDIGKLKLKGTWDLHFYQLEQIKRVRLIKRADGYYCQLLIQADINVETTPTQKTTGIDLGLNYFIADSSGNVVESPKYYRKSSKKLSRLNRRKSRKYRNPGKGKKGAKMVKVPKQRQSNNYHKARVRYARKHLKVSRQREEFVKRVANCVIQSNDLVAYEDLNVKGMVKNRHLAKSISDAGWSTFRRWLEHFGRKYGKVTVAVPPHNTSQNCSSCGQTVKKSLSTRTHICDHCGFVEDRDVNAALNILQKGLSTVGHTESNAWGDTPSSCVGEILHDYGESLNQESLSL